MSELYELPDGWEWKTIDEFTTIKSGKRVPKGQKLLDDTTSYPYIRVTDFSDTGTVDTSDIKFISEEIYQQIKNYKITDDDIYISVAGTIGKTGIIPSELNGANLTENAVKIVFDNTKYDKNFIFNFTNSNTFMEQIGLATKTVAMPKLAIKRLKEVQIPLPPLSEQQRIVSKLDLLFEKIDKSIALHQKNMDEANAFMGSVLNDVFGELEAKYAKKQLSSVIKIIGGGTPSTKEREYWDNGTIKWATVGDMNVETIIDTELLITEKGLKEPKYNTSGMWKKMGSTVDDLKKHISVDMGVKQEKIILLEVSEQLGNGVYILCVDGQKMKWRRTGSVFRKDGEDVLEMKNE